MEDAAASAKPFSFHRRYRLTRPGEFSRVFNRAQRSADKFFTVLYRNSDAPTARLGFAIAKKKIAAANRRNRIRRIARESFRHQRSALPAIDIIILAQPAAMKASNTELFASLDKHWQRLQKVRN